MVQQADTLPVIIISGFLGAGKTSLLNHVLQTRQGIRAGVLVNDFGAINIDSELVVSVEGETLQLANGCICCSIRDDLVAACLQLLQKTNRPEVLLIETSGVSNPFQVANTFLESEALQPHFSLSCLLTVVDATQHLQIEEQHAWLARDQVMAADVVLLNKVDLVSPACLEKVNHSLKAIVPGIRSLPVTHGRIPTDLLPASGHKPRKRRQPGDRPTAALDFSSCHWTSEQPLSLPRLKSFLEHLDESVYRVKGFVYLEELPSCRFILQMVGKRYSIREDTGWPSTPGSTIVMIGTMNTTCIESLQALLEQCIGSGDEAGSPVLKLARRLNLQEKDF